MSDAQPSGTKSIRLERYILALAITWTIVMAGLLAWNIREAGEIAQDIARSQAQLYVDVPTLLADEQRTMAVEVPSLALLWVLGLAGIGLSARSLLHHARERDRAEEELSKHRAHLEEMVQERTIELTHVNQQLQMEIAEHKRAEEEQRALRQALGERVNELDCLYSIAALIEKAGVLEEVLQGVVVLAPSGWQYPEIACARIVLRGQEFKTENYRETPWRQSGDIVARGELVGKLDVCYLEERPACDEGPFLKEERKLLVAIAERLGRVAERMGAEEALRQQNEYLAALQETTLDLISRLNLDNLLENIVKRAGQLLGTPHCYLDLIEPGTSRLKPKVGRGALRQSLEFEVQPGEGVAGTVWQTGRPLVIDDYDAWPGRIQGYNYHILRTVIGVPLLSDSQVMGVLGLAYDWTTDQAFGQQSIELLDQFARLAVIAIENARLFEQTQQDARTKAELLKEVNHRVKNNLVAILGLLLAEKHYTPAKGRFYVEPAIDSLSHRIEGLLEVHQMLSESAWAPMRLSDLATRIVQAVLNAVPPDRHVVADISPSPIEVSPRQANNLALVINELATNTIKYALAGRETVRIVVCAAVEGDMICLEYRDDGPGYPEEMLRLERYNVGLNLLQALVTRSLHGTLTLANDGGAVATMHIKVEEKERT
jgi:two-component sensor histidine kinase